MANCVIYIKGSDEIAYFIRDCIQAGRDFQGSNGSVMGVKERLFDTKWTEDIPVQDEKGSWDKKISDLAPALTYKGQVVSNRDDVDTIIKAEIRKRYSLEDELKLQRQRDMLPKEFKEYYDFVENLRAEGRAFKNKYFGEEK